MKQKILIVDDLESIRDLMRDAFTKVGFEVFTCESAEEALQVAIRENIQVHFYDLHLPGMNGIELCREIRKKRPVDLIYAMTGHPSIYALVECREAGFDDYFIKPFDLRTILETTERAFDTIKRWKRQ
ncbi:MAG: response regulator [Candidatus Neomarinimicrobiota bacterium]